MSIQSSPIAEAVCGTVETRYDNEGELDELVIDQDAIEGVHIERMDIGSWWVCINLRNGQRCVVRFFTARSGKTEIRATEGIE